MKYDEYMDKECINLCDALNEIPGIETNESCCGHGKSSYNVWFYLDKKYFQNLHVVARAICNRYGGFNHWRCEVYCNDMYQSGRLSFWLNSGDSYGEEAYREADIIAENIRHHLSHEVYKSMFEISIPEK